MMDRLLGPPLTDAERAVMLEEARALLGLRWRHKGRTARGADCLGYLWMVLSRTFARVRGMQLPLPRKDYGRTPFNRELRAGLVEWLGEPVDELQPGDVITMRWTGEEHHVGIVTPHALHGLGLIHADNMAAGGPRVVEHGMDYVWKRRLIEAWRP